MTRRGDVVPVRFPFTDVGKAKVRPAIVVQNDRDNQKIHNTVVAMVTGNLRRLGDPSHFLIDPAHPEGAGSGLSGPSMASCNNLQTVAQSAILRSLARLSDVLMRQLDACLKAALELP
ncbi:MAG TPA: type II toxin-antitoxin system PemK/MazF family toxin [Gemmataceae bacterium]|nr:type II toxin-antitoxin system PemK/MazF family toxin [Gemmataceae bacterium]